MILIVEHDPAQARMLAAALARAGLAHALADSVDEAERLLARPEPDAPSLAAVGLDLPGDALAVLRRVRDGRPDLPILALSAHASVSRVVAAMRAGADDVLPTPVAPDRLARAVRAALERARDGARNGARDGGARDGVRDGARTGSRDAQAARRPRRPQAAAAVGPDPFADLVAASAAAREAVALARRAAASDIPVLFEGESGVGKEVFARALHAASRRAGGPFVAVNCGALPEALVESLLFGHEKGAFTGAVERRPGRFAEAEGGTLFLDEVGDLPLLAQVKLLRALQEREVDPVGADRPRRVDIRVIAATNRDLRAEIAAGRFREDLYWRLAAFPIRLPPLRERRADVPELARRLVARIAAAEGRPAPELTGGACAALAAAPWPGNVRELENALHRAMVVAGAQPLDAARFEALVPAPRPAAPPRAAGDPALDAEGHVLPLAAVEAAHIRRALDRYDGCMAEAARRLGIGRSTLYRKLADVAGPADGA